MSFPIVNIQLPGWVDNILDKTGEFFPTVENRMNFVIELSRQNIEQKSGGPFGAAVFDNEGRLIAPGVNMVVSNNCSILHAEMVALALAQNILGRYDIGDAGRFSYDLVASTEPCAMCFGAIPWSGINRLICGARDEDARAVGFDEGPKLPNWEEELSSRGITVKRDVLRDKAVAVLQEYAKSDEPTYNTGKHIRPTTY